MLLRVIAIIHGLLGFLLVQFGNKISGQRQKLGIKGKNDRFAIKKQIESKQ
jgi:hypothetical protein